MSELLWDELEQAFSGLNGLDGRIRRLERALRALLAEVANQPTHAAEVATKILNEE